MQFFPHPDYVVKKMCPNNPQDNRIPMVSEKVSEFLLRTPRIPVKSDDCDCRRCCICFFSPMLVHCRCTMCSNHDRTDNFWEPQGKPFRLRQVLEKLRDCLLLSLFILSVVRLPVVMAAPSRSRTPSPPPPWMCPCGETGDQDIDNEYGLVSTPISDRELVSRIILQARISLDEATRFKDEYVFRTFGVDYHTHHESWRRNHFGWLPNRQEIPKELGKSVSDEHLSIMSIAPAMEKIYEFLQKIAVGMEQVEKDQRHYGGEFLQQFTNINGSLRQVLCEIHLAMAEREITPVNKVSPEIMKYEVRALQDRSHRNLRDWLIFREYMNVLEYLVQVFSYIEEQMPL